MPRSKRKIKSVTRTTIVYANFPKSTRVRAHLRKGRRVNTHYRKVGMRLVRVPYGKKNVPKEDREYRIEGHGPVGTIKEYKETFPGKTFEIEDPIEDESPGMVNRNKFRKVSMKLQPISLREAQILNYGKPINKIKILSDQDKKNVRNRIEIAKIVNLKPQLDRSEKKYARENRLI